MNITILGRLGKEQRLFNSNVIKIKRFMIAT